MGQGNRPDCAYYLVIGLTLAGFLITVGGVFSYVAYWPEVALEEPLTPHHLHHRYGTVMANNGQKGAETKDNYISSPLSILGPFFLGVGVLLLVIVIVLGMKYKCDYEPEPNIAFLRLQSEWSLNLDSDRNKYELMVANRPSGQRSGTVSEAGPSQIV